MDRSLTMDEVLNMSNQLPAGYTARPATMDDLEDVVETINAAAREKIGGDKFNASDYRVDWETPDFNLETDTRLVISLDGQVAGIYEFWDNSEPHVRYVVWGRIHPEHEGLGIGTQMLAKGLDLPLVTLVGAVLADVGLQLPDYRAAERSFQVLTQVAGRAGRSPLGGQVIFQTFQPDNYVIQHAAEHDYRGFYKHELDYRRRLGYPPFGRLLRLEFKGRNEPEVEQNAQNLARQIEGWIAQSGQRALEMLGPLPCFFARVGGDYRWQIVLRGPDPAAVLRGQNWGSARVEVDPTSLL